MAVSKFHPAEVVMEAYRAGQRCFGESRPQEFMAKAQSLPKDIVWHFIGHLQTNKLKMVLPYAAMVESVDSEHLLQAIDKWGVENGKVVDYDAARGKEVLRNIIETDENAGRLGECALISKNTPIRETGLLFYDTLYDENASCHLALGMGFPECVEGGYDMTSDELMEHGVNRSHTHVDFMIGADDLDVWGVRADGSEEPIFVGGQWAWENN